MTASRDVRVVIAARRYLLARIALEGAGAADLLPAALEVDDAYHQLVVASGLNCADVGCVHTHDDDDRADIVDTKDPTLEDDT